MNCPKCKSAITKLERYCGECGHDFGEELYDKLSYYFSWKDELDRLTQLQNSLYSGIANVSARIKRYEEVLRRDLERATAGMNEKGKEAAPVQKSPRPVIFTKAHDNVPLPPRERRGDKSLFKKIRKIFS